MRLIVLIMTFAQLCPLSAMAEVVLPKCASNDRRTPIEVWKPQSDAQGNVGSDPPEGDGKIVYIELFGENSRLGCATAKPGNLYSFYRPYGSGLGGLQINLRGNVHPSSDLCYFSGFFMNEKVFGMHQGWIETYFGAVDKFEIIKSGNFCIHAP